jgi:rhamnosyltransferase subunit B
MARIVLTTFGSGGDLNPFIALGLGLRARGHDILFAVEDGFRRTVERAGFPVHRLSGDATETMAAHTGEMIGKSTPLASVRLLVEKYIIPTLPPKIEELRAASAGADLLVASSTQVAASFVADLDAIPLAHVTLTPITVPSMYIEPQPLPIALPPLLQRAANRASWEFGIRLVARVFDPPVNRLRAAYGLPPHHDWMYTRADNTSARLTAVAVSPAFCPPPPDWPSSVLVTGFLFWDTPSDWHEPDELTAFFADGAPVVAVSSGSMSLDVAHAFGAFYTESIAAIRQAGARALVIGAPAEVLPNPLPTGVLALPFAPFSSIYPRCAAVIHHGGIGTTAQGLRAGVPQLIVPWGVDQYYTGAQVARIGAGRWLQRRAYTLERAARLVADLLYAPAYRQRAAAIAATLEAEDGVATLCDALETLAAPTAHLTPGRAAHE